MIREIPALYTLTIKEIAKVPTKFINEKRLKRADKIRGKDDLDFDLPQTLIDYVTEAGRMTDDIVPVSSFTSSRTTLRLKNTKVSGRYLKKILETTGAITELDVGGTFQVDDESVLAITTNCPKLKVLNIRNCKKLTDRSLEHILKCDSLVSLNIGGNFNMTVSGILHFLKTKLATRLEELHLSGLPITDEMMEIIGRRCNSLKTLGINYTDVSESSIRACLNEIGERLQILSVAWIAVSTDLTATQISEDFFSQFLPKACPKLVDLDVTGIRNLHAAALLSYLDAKQFEVRPKDHIAVNLLNCILTFVFRLHPTAKLPY